ncbi:sugar ABC transporter substrate-binding protein [Novacetimonas maltaceti]|uniref:Putative ABC transporter-binding protein n=1 Tax=Novacetimonas maltaceti TaxID=1203393 RepID=A0A2S3VYA8_9PROT|nr:extracellular solute-binding protein [Novacetimonas maltaceti]POF61606.1 putative ABC transporter-binding protein precursor [Novacetimonas maltaceti]PYD60018.1 sugar ABC transporter substrate-binding protein [Novacetimonas maltaceti]
MKSLRLALLPLAVLLFGSPAHGAPLTVFCSSSGTEQALCHHAVEDWSRHGGEEVRVLPLPSDWGAVLPLYRQFLSARTSVADILVLDSTWIGALAPLLLELPASADDAQTMPHPFTVGGRRVALAWYRDIGLLFYRRDLLEQYGLAVPTRWDELQHTAATIQEAQRRDGNTALWGYVWQGRTGESLVCNALEWFGGGDGELVRDDGSVHADTPAMRQGLGRAAGWIGTISPRGVLTYDEEAARGAFQSGHAVFMRNWVYAWALLNDPQSPLAGRVGVAALPRADGAHAPTGIDGTVYLGIARNSTHRAQAISLLRYLTSEEVERRQAITGAYIPARTPLLDDPDVVRAIPVLRTIRPILDAPILRPIAATGIDYPRVSWIASNHFQQALRGTMTPPAALQSLSTTLAGLSRLGQWARPDHSLPSPSLQDHMP